MVTIDKQGNNFIFEIKGMHKIWAFKSSLTIPIDHILNVRQNIEIINGWKGWRFPGTHIPFIITAGTFYKDGNKIFWDVSNIKNCIIVDLKDEKYMQLIIEVINPAEAIKTLTNLE